MEAFDEILTANDAYVASGRHVPLPVRPSRRLAIITCMDSRIPAFPVLGLRLGEAHVLRTAGARVTDDVLRSLALSTHVLGTRAAILVGHTRCGLYDPDGSIEATLTELMGRPPFNRSWGTFSDPAEAIRSDVERLLMWPDRPEGFEVAGLQLDVDTGRLSTVLPPQRAQPVAPPPSHA